MLFAREWISIYHIHMLLFFVSLPFDDCCVCWWWGDALFSFAFISFLVVLVCVLVSSFKPKTMFDFQEFDLDRWCVNTIFWTGQVDSWSSISSERESEKQKRKNVKISDRARIQFHAWCLLSMFLSHKFSEMKYNTERSSNDGKDRKWSEDGFKWFGQIIIYTWKVYRSV